MTDTLKSILATACFVLLPACQNTDNSPASAQHFDSRPANEALSAMVDEKTVAGVSALIYAGGNEIYFGAFGDANIEAEDPLSRDTQFLIYSMTKPITGVTLMSLYEDGLFKLDDPITKYLPEFETVKVISGISDSGAPILETPRRAIRIIDLFRHTACFGYGWEGHPAAEYMTAADVLNPAKPLSQMSEDLSKVPLYCHPGEEWKYGVSMDILARLGEVVAGKPYETLVYERVLTPLKMTDTHYFIAPDARGRMASIYTKQDNGDLLLTPETGNWRIGEVKRAQTNGGHGLISTVDDYMRFALMLQNEGKLDGAEILKPETVALMSQDHLPKGITEKEFLPSKGSVGFGLTMAVRIANPASEAEPYGALGEFFWDGAASPFFWVDPENDITAVFMTQIHPFNGNIQKAFRRAVYEGFDLHKLPESTEP